MSISRNQTATTKLVTTDMSNATPITDPTLLAVLSAASAARQQALSLIDLLQQSRPAVDGDGDDDASTAAVDTSARALEARIALLRGLNRRAITQVRSTKADTTEARQEIDGLHLGLQNLYYEQRHLRGEIGGCEGFEYVCPSRCPLHMLFGPLMCVTAINTRNSQ